MRPHRNKYWLFAKITDRASFEREVQRVCQAYRQAIELFKRDGTRTICIDEQTGIQALERIAPDQPVAAGRITRREYEYRRHGTIGLFGNLDVASGKVLCPMLRETRTEEDFLENLDNVISEDPNVPYRIIVDNLNTHASELVVRYVAESCQLPDELGQKGRWGILKDLPSRRAFLSDPTHRIQFIFTPKHCSWLNQIEIWFGILRRKVTRYGSFPCIESLCSRISQFIDYYNRTMAEPFSWTYSGRLLCR